MNRNILVVEDDLNLSAVLSRVLRREGYDVAVSNTVADGIDRVRSEAPGIVLTDIYLPDGNGIDILEYAKSIGAGTDVIVMTANATVESAIEALKKGAQDYLLKPFQVDELVILFRKIFERKALIAENLYLKGEIRTRSGFADLVGESPCMRDLFEVVDSLSRSGAGVLIQGESGTGKELIARAIHFRGDRAERMFVPINCSAIPDNLLESELFGHLKGSYTGAAENKKGLFEHADKGTLFLDEIGDLSTALQAKLLRVLQDGRIRRIGDFREIEVDTRIVAATNKDLPALIKHGDFREDLYYRLAVVPIRVPPLRERREDIPLLAGHFTGKYAVPKQREIRFADETLETLGSYAWPGNVRELKNLVERLTILRPGRTIGPDDLPAEMTSGSSAFDAIAPGAGYQEAKQRMLDDFHRKFIDKALTEHGGNVSRAAESIGMDRGNFQRLLRRYGVRSSAFRPDE
ncbi:MAG: sigma-54-dependent Fis family transcriptional regulator [Deltaproteobacteria bacterium]|nr:sigma-54-dependent Fis family transcriptional regulator [Deltaproteobacteria bacterium]